MLRRHLLSRFFDLLYTRLAWAYDSVAWIVSAGQWYRWTEAALPFIEEGPLLEVGCGRGRLLRRLAALGVQAIGVDRSAQMARYAAQLSGLPVIQADGLHLPFAEGRFRTLVTTFPAPYVLQEATQREFARVVAPGGLWLWVDTPALDPAASTALARLVTRVAQGSPEERQELLPMREDRSGGCWSIHIERVRIGATSVAVRVARRRA